MRDWSWIVYLSHTSSLITRLRPNKGNVSIILQLGGRLLACLPALELRKLEKTHRPSIPIKIPWKWKWWLFWPWPVKTWRRYNTIYNTNINQTVRRRPWSHPSGWCCLRLVINVQLVVQTATVNPQKVVHFSMRSVVYNEPVLIAGISMKSTILGPNHCLRHEPSPRHDEEVRGYGDHLVRVDRISRSATHHLVLLLLLHLRAGGGGNQMGSQFAFTVEMSSISKQSAGEL